MSAVWKEAYAAMHRAGEASFPPACLQYLLEVVRSVARRNAGSGHTRNVGDVGGVGAVGTADSPGRELTPADTVNAVRQAVRADFGPLFADVLEDWGLRTPEDVGRAIALLGRHDCLALGQDDQPDSFATDTVALAEEYP